MKRLISILLLGTFLSLGSGVLEYLHNLTHAWEDAASNRLAQKAHEPIKIPPVHDDSNCAIHAQLHIPLMTPGIVQVLILLGLIVAFLSEIAQPLFSHQSFFRLDCRGPPVC